MYLIWYIDLIKEGLLFAPENGVWGNVSLFYPLFLKDLG
jgi:hypothetical protein